MKTISSESLSLLTDLMKYPGWHVLIKLLEDEFEQKTEYLAYTPSTLDVENLAIWRASKKILDRLNNLENEIITLTGELENSIL